MIDAYLMHEKERAAQGIPALPLNADQASAGREKHICPLQLDVIERSIHLWSNPGDLVMSPFTGIGSEGYCAVKMNRRFVGSELKPEYCKVAVKNLRKAERMSDVGADLFVGSEDA